MQPVPHNLPLQLSSFIGRAREIAELRRVLSPARLVTLTGTGGCGKTRLALAVAAEQLDRFRDGVWFVGLAPLTDAGLVAQAVAAALNLHDAPGRPLETTLADYLRARHLLLILDNCEHLVEACAQLADQLLCACPTLHILATSRQLLGVAGETRYRVPPLTIPPAALGPSASPAMLDRLARYEAAQLFVERAQAVQTRFALTPTNAAAVASICRHLDGIPLALELAAARTRHFSAGQIAERLDDRFRLLSDGGRTRPARHQTLRAAIDWSYDLLSEPERLLLRRLSVFAGGWSFEAAESVCAGDGLERHDILGLLAQLIDKSLVLVEEQSDGAEVRYQMLESIRQYAREKLLKSGESERLRHRHLQFFRTLSSESESKLRGPEQLLGLNVLGTEHDNLRLALEWSLESGDGPAGLELAVSLTDFWVLRGFGKEGSAWLRRLLAATEALGRDRAQGLTALAQAARTQDRTAEALAALDVAIAIYREHDDRSGLAYALAERAQAAVDHGEHVAAYASAAESVALFRGLTDEWGLGRALRCLGRAARHSGKYREAQSPLEESVAIFRKLGDRWALAAVVGLLGTNEAELGHYAQGIAHNEERLALDQELGDRYGMATALSWLGHVARVQHEYERASLLLHESLALHQELGHDGGVALVLTSLGQVALNCGDLPRAWTLFREALVLDDKIGHHWRSLTDVSAMACLAQSAGQPEHAARLFGAVEALFESMHQTLWLADRLDRDQRVAALRDELDEATLATAWAEGRALTVQQAIAEALSVDAPTAPPATLAQPLAASAPPIIEVKREPAGKPVAEVVPLRILALGGVQVYRGAQALTSADWTYAKCRELLFYLLCYPSRTREQIGVALWPDASPSQLRSNFGAIMHYLRRALSSADWIVFQNERYAFNHTLPYWFDVEAFEAYIAGAHKALGTGGASGARGSQALTQLEQAVGLYRGDFLSDQALGDWAMARQEDLRRKCLEALLTLGRLYQAQRRYAEAVDIYQKAIAQDGYLETAHRELMRSLARQGERAQALRQYQHLVELLRAELHAPPARETTALYQRLQRGEAI